MGFTASLENAARSLLVKKDREGKMSPPTLYAIIEFSRPVLCAADVLSESYDIVVGDYIGKLHFPSLRHIGDQDYYSTNQALVGPANP